jgi:rhodanese-related sulfurtransferase
MSSSELLRRKDLDENLIIIDVRTNPERQVSMIPGAISLKTFERDVVSTLLTSTTTTSTTGDQWPTIVTYCTIGYRSGMEARRLGQKYHYILQGRTTIYSLDGIVAYTHALAAASFEKKENGKELGAATQQLIRTDNDPDATTQDQLQQPPIETNQVHTFGAIWNLAPDGCTIQHFSILVFLGRTAQVGGTSVLRTFQRLAFGCRSCCVREKLH